MHVSYSTDGGIDSSNSVASFCEECVLWRVFGFHLTAPHKNRITLLLEKLRTTLEKNYKINSVDDS